MSGNVEKAPFELSREALEILEANKRQMEADLAAGRIQPGHRRSVTMPNGDRFHIALPNLEAERRPASKRRGLFKRFRKQA